MSNKDEELKMEEEFESSDEQDDIAMVKLRREDEANDDVI